MQREMPETDLNVVLTAEAFNTDRTEVTPRSDVVREHMQDDGRSEGHGNWYQVSAEEFRTYLAVTGDRMGT